MGCANTFSHHQLVFRARWMRECVVCLDYGAWGRAAVTTPGISRRRGEHTGASRYSQPGFCACFTVAGDKLSAHAEYSQHSKAGAVLIR